MSDYRSFVTLNCFKKSAKIVCKFSSLLIGVDDTGEKMVAGDIDTGEKIVTGEVNTGKKMIAGDVDTGNIDICPSFGEGIIGGMAAYIDHGLVDQWSAVEL